MPCVESDRRRDNRVDLDQRHPVLTIDVRPVSRVPSLHLPQGTSACYLAAASGLYQIFIRDA
jgi:hypothetical protein